MYFLFPLLWGLLCQPPKITLIFVTLLHWSSEGAIWPCNLINSSVDNVLASAGAFAAIALQVRQN